MELIYFILGFLFTVTSYGIVLLSKTKSSHTALLKEIHSYKDISFQQFDRSVAKNSLLETKMKQVSEEYSSVQKQLETDTYAGNNKLNKRITELAESFNKQGSENKRLFDVADNQLRTQKGEIQTLRSNFQKFSNDPNIIDKY